VEFPQIFNEKLRTVKGILGRLGTEVDGAQGKYSYPALLPLIVLLIQFL
jgi:hypothetical protein